MQYVEFIISNLEYIIPGLVSACFLVVNIIQGIRGRSKKKLNEAICRIPEILRVVEAMFGKKDDSTPPPLLSGSLNADLWSISKKATAESILENEFGKKFVKKYISVLDDAIEDILNTPQKKGGSNDGISKENEAR